MIRGNNSSQAKVEADIKILLEPVVGYITSLREQDALTARVVSCLFQEIREVNQAAQNLARNS